MKALNSETRSAQHTAYGLFIFSAMAEACILPYTTLYLKNLGLSATHAGVVKSIQYFLSIWTLIFWMHFATRFSAYRVVIVSSVLLSIIGFLCATLLAPMDTSVYLISCPYAPATDVIVNTTDKLPLLITEDIKEMKTANQQTLPDKERRKFYYENDDWYENKGQKNDYESDRSHSFGEIDDDLSKRQYLDSETDYGNGNAYYDDGNSFPVKRTRQQNRDIDKRSILNSIWDAINPKKTTTTTTTTTQKTRIHQTDADYPTTLTSTLATTTTTFIPEIYPDLEYDPPILKTKDNPTPNRLSYLLLFITFMLGWIFGSPATTVADQAWYGYLDDLDLTEKYGNHNVYCLFMAGLASLATSLTVAMTNCRLWFDIDHFNIHFYMYAFFMLYTLLFAFCFPTVSSKFSLALPQTTKMSEYKLLFCDLSLSLVTFTAILGGIFNSCVDDFLLWIIEDLGGNEFHFGTIVCLNFMFDIFAANTSRYLLRKMKLHLVLVFSVTIFSLRLLFFSFLWNPWSAVTGQFIHFFSSTLMPAVMSAYLSRTSDHSSYRAIRTVMVPCLNLFGRTIGSCAFGVGYDVFGASLMYQITAGIGFLWSLILLIVYKMKLGNSKRYVKLIHVQEIDGIMGDSETDEDWLDETVAKRDNSPTSA
uniref:Major facilitator superfamily associated domain-containing protein n=1 Tax=Strigamia maritima TaxID=126957 RepID=T1IMA3_STRMM